MAEALKHHYGPEIPRAIARMIAAVYPRFNAPSGQVFNYHIHERALAAN